MPHVLLLTSRYPPFSGGAETYARELSSRLPALGWSVTVATDGAAAGALPGRTGRVTRRG